MLCFPQYLCNIDLAVLDIPHFPCMLTGVHQRPPRVSWQCCIFPNNSVLRCKFKSPVATPKGNVSTRFASGNVELLTAQPIRFLRRNAGFGRLMIHYSSNAGISLQRPQNLIQVWDFPKICPQNSPRGAAVLDCAVFLAKPTSQNYFFSAFFSLAQDRDAFPRLHFSADLRSATDVLAKKHPHALAKPHLFRAAAFFGTIRAGKKTPSGTRGLFPANNRAGKKTPSETRVLFPGDPKSWQRKIQRWQKNTQSSQSTSQ